MSTKAMTTILGNLAFLGVKDMQVDGEVTVGKKRLRIKTGLANLCANRSTLLSMVPRSPGELLCPTVSVFHNMKQIGTIDSNGYFYYTEAESLPVFLAWVVATSTRKRLLRYQIDMEAERLLAIIKTASPDNPESCRRVYQDSFYLQMNSAVPDGGPCLRSPVWSFCFQKLHGKKPPPLGFIEAY